MSWREALLTRGGPGVLAGITLRDWTALLARERLLPAPRAWPRALSITAQSVGNTLQGALERAIFGARVDAARIEPPVFVLGHWRSGTTHLHNLLACDRRFAFPNNYQVTFPHTFLVSEALGSRLLAPFIPRRRPMDNVEWDLRSPQEDEFALCAATCLSPCMAWVLPGRRAHFERYLTFRNVSDVELERWSRAFQRFLKKLTVKYGPRPLLLKSPPHTARIARLLELFPTAKFVHIARHPEAVFQSSRKLFRTIFEWHRLEPPHLEDLDDWILAQYERLYDAYFDDRGKIPPGHLHELRFEDLERDSLGELERLYGALGLPTFGEARPAVESYVATLAGYRKNALPEVEERLRERVRRTARKCLGEWYG